MADNDKLGIFIQVKPDPTSINRMVQEIETKMRSRPVNVSAGIGTSGKSSADMSKDIAKVQRAQTAFNNLTRQINNYLSTNTKIKAQNGDTYKGFTSLQEAIQKGNISISEARLKYSQLTAQTKELGLQHKTFGSSIKEAFGRYAAIGFATTGLLMIKQTLKQMVVAVKELDKSIVDLQIATGMTYTQAKALLSTYTELGKQMGATTVQVAQAADSFLRQGYSIADSNELVKQSLMLSKLGQIDSAESTKYLTSAMKGYKVEVADAAGIVDKLTAVDMEAAVTSGGIAEAMSMTANGARLAGVDMNKLIGIMTATGEVSQAEMSRIGTAYKTMFARMSNVKLGRMEDDEGVDITAEINEVEKVLNKIGIPLRKSATEWNNFGDVLDQIGAKWSTLNEIQKSAITTGLGGVRQKEFGITLFENYDKALKYEKTALESSGTALEKFNNAYLGSIEAKTNAFKASFESFSMSIINSDVLKYIMDIGSATLSWLDGTDKIIPTMYRVLGVATAIGVVLKRNAIAASLQSYGQLGIAKKAISAGAAGVSTATTTAADALRAAQINNVANATTRLTGANLAAFASYAKLSQAEVINILTTQKLTEAEIETEVVKLKSVFATNSQTVSTGAYTGVMSGLIIRIKQATVAMLKFLATNPVGWAILATTAVVGIWKSFEYMGQEANRAKKELEEINTTFSESKDKLKSLGDEIDSNNERIGELLSKGTLKLVEQDELDKLKQSNVALSLQLSTLKLETAELQRQAKIKADVLIASMSVDQSSGTMMGKTADMTTYVLNKVIDLIGKISGIKNLGDVLKFPEIPDSYDDLISTTIDKVKQLSTEIESLGDPAFMGADAKAKYDSLKASLDLHKGQLSDVALKYQAIAAAYDGEDTGKNALKMVEKLTYAISGATEKSEIFYKEFSKTTGLKTDIESLSRSQALNVESVDKLMRRYPKFKIFIDELGISTEDLVREFTNAIDPIAEMNRTISDLKTTMDGLPERMEDLESINKKVSDGYHFSITEIDEIIKKYPQLESAVTRTAYGFQIASGAINTLSTGISFTSEEIEFLESAHGSLNATLDEATGLYYLNSDALSALGISAIQAKIDYNQFQIDTTKSAIENSGIRIGLLFSEMEALLEIGALSDDFIGPPTLEVSKILKEEGLKTSLEKLKQYKSEVEQYQSQLDRIGTGSVSGYTPEKSKAKTAEELLEEEKKLQRDAFEAQKAIIDRQLALNLITEEQYTNSLESLYKQFYSDKSKYLDEYTRYEIEVYNKRQSLIEQAEKEIEAARAAHNSAFEAAKAPLDRQLDLDLMTEKQYVDKLEALYKSYFSDKSQYLDEYTKYEVDVYKRRKSLLEQAEKDAEQARKDAEQAQKDAESAHKAAFEAAKAALERQLDLNLITEKQYIDSLESLYKRYFSDKSKYLDEYTRYEVEVYKKRQALLEQAQKDIDAIRQATIEMIKQEKKADKEALEAKKNSLKEYIDARKQALSDARDQDKHDKSIRDQSSDIENIQARLMGLSGDTSAAGMRKKLELRDQLVQAQEKLSETVADKEYSMQIKALEDSQKVQEDKINSQIESIDKFLNNQENLVRASLDRMNGMSYQLKSDLIAYTKEYGDGIADNITKSWEAATEALRQYGSVANIQGTMGTITTHIGGAAGDVPREYAKGTSGLPRDSIIVGTHELLLNKNQDGRYQMMSAGSPIFTESQVEGLKKLLGSPSFSTNKQLGGVGSTATASVVSMVNSNNANNVEIHYEMNISGTNPEGIASEIDKHLPRISDYTMNRVNKDILINKGVRRSAGSLN